MSEEIILSWEGVQYLLLMSRKLEQIYNEYVESGEKLRKIVFGNVDDLGYDAEEIKQFVIRHDYQIRCNADALHNLNAFCKKEATYFATLLSTGIAGAAPNTKYSDITAFQKMSAYMVSHKYSERDAEVYMNDPEWRSLNAALKKEMDGQSKKEGVLNAFGGKICGDNLTQDVKNKTIRLEEKQPMLSNGQVARTNAMILAQEQGYLGRPLLVDKKAFNDAVKTSGVKLYRGLSDDTDIVTNESKTGKQFKKEFIHSDTIRLNMAGRTSYGPGIYMTGSANSRAYTEPSLVDSNNALEEAGYYACGSTSAILEMTLSSDAKIIDGSELRRMYEQLVADNNDAYFDANVYAIAMGFDGVKNQGAGCFGCDYYTIFNRTALIVLDN